MNKKEDIVIHVERVDAGREITFEEQLRSIEGIGIEDFIKKLKLNEGGKYNNIFLPEKAS